MSMTRAGEMVKRAYHPPPSARADWYASLTPVASRPFSDIVLLHERPFSHDELFGVRGTAESQTLSLMIRTGFGGR